MESTKHWVSSQPASTQCPESSTHCYSAQQDLQAGYMGQEIGGTQHELFGQYNISPHPGFLPTAPFPDMRQVILREIEKEQIRAQKILSEITKMHVLEGEISKEMIQVGAADLGVTKNDEEEEKTILVANPDANIPGSEWKAVTQPVADTSKRPSDILYEKAEVIATSESALNEHLCKKKQTLNEASLKPQSPGKNSSIGKNAADTVLLKQTELLENLKPENFEDDQEKTIPSVQKNGDPKMTIYSFWCEMCEVGTSSEIVMNDHEKGKKHLRLLKERAQKGETGEGNQKEKIEVPVNCVEHVSESGKSIHSCNVDVVLAEASSELHKPLDASDNGFETLPIQIRAADHRVSEVMPVTENCKEVEKIIFVDNPDATIFGSKSKAVTLPVIETTKCPSDNILHKKAEAEQSCAFCQVIVTSESALNEHLCEKKHKFREGSLKPQSPGNCSVDTMLLEKTELLENPKPDNFKTDQAKTIQSVQKNPDPKKTVYNFWCEMCQVGASSEIVMNGHEKGKKHIKRLKEKAENGETGSSNQNEKMEVPVNCVQHVSEGGKIILLENVDVCEKGSHKSVNESKAKEYERALEVTEQDETNAQGVDIIEPVVDLTNDAVFPDDYEIIAKGKWSCDLCQVIAITVSALNEFLHGRKQKLKEASLEAPTPGRNFSVGKIAADTLLLKETEFLENSKSDQLKTIQSVQKNDDPKRITDSFWREKCQVGTWSEENMNNREEEIVQNGEIGPCIEKEKIEEPLNCDNHISEGGKSILSNNVDVVSAEARLELQKSLDTSDNGFETFLIQIGTVDLRVSEVKPVAENGKKEDIILVANPYADSSKRPSDIILYKKAEGERSCVATSESAPNEPMCEKKQKLVEASLKPQSPGKNSSIGKMSHDTLLLKKTELLEDPKADNFKKDPSVLKKDDPKKKKDNFWLEKCRVGTSLGKVVTDEEKGRKYVNHLKEIVQNSETRPCYQKENIEVSANYVEHKGEKSIISDNVDVFSSEARLELHKPLDASDNGFETLCIQFGTVDLRVSEVKPVTTHGKKEEIIFVSSPDANKSGSKWKAVTPPVADTSKSALNDMCEKKHKLKEDSLKPQSPGKHSSIGKISHDTLLSKKSELVVNLKSDNFEKNQAKTIQSVQKNGDAKKTKERTQREKYQVRTSSDKVVNVEEKGRKRNKIVQNGETGPCGHKEKIDEPVNRVKHISEDGKIIFSHILTKQDDAKAAGVNIIKSGDNSTLHAVLPKDGETNAKGKRSCALCQVIAPNESSLNEHLCGKKHKLKEASLKTQRPRNNSSVGNVAADTLLEYPKSDNIRKDSAKTIRSVGKNGDLKKTKYSYCREICQVGPSEKVTHNLKNGKEKAQNDESGPCNQEKMEVPANCVEHVSESEKSIFSEFFGVVSSQARLELPKPLDASNNGDKQNKKRWQIKIKD